MKNKEKDEQNLANWFKYVDSISQNMLHSVGHGVTICCLISVLAAIMFYVVFS